MVTDWASLKTAISTWLPHDDVEGQEDTFIQLFEAEVNRRLRLLDMVRSETGTIAAGTLALVTGALEPINFGMLTIPRRNLAYLPPEQFFESDYNEAGAPTHYTLVGRTAYVRKTPSSPGYDYQLNYVGEIDGLSSTNTTNFLIEKAPDAYLFGCLEHASAYAVGETRGPEFERKKERAFRGLINADRRARARGGRQRQRPRGIHLP